jgi:hypothetical protein
LKVCTALRLPRHSARRLSWAFLSRRGSINARRNPLRRPPKHRDPMPPHCPCESQGFVFVLVR